MRLTQTWLLAALVALLVPGAAASGGNRGPRLIEPLVDRLAAIRCHGELVRSPWPPVLLVPGSLTDAEEAWSWGYRKVLLERGHSVCTVRLPEFGFGDAQRTVEYVVTAVERIRRRSGRRVSIVGHSQGGFQAVFALRVWRRAARFVDDVVALAGVYDRGSEWAREQLDPASRTPDSRPYCTEQCVPWHIQRASGSALLGALGRRHLPEGPSYTAIGTLYDENITPQPQANELPPGGESRSMQIQDVCPGRRFAMNHASMLADSVAHALVLDALEHGGPAQVDRIPRIVCSQGTYDGADMAGFARALADILPRFVQPQQEVESEPLLRCHLDARCEDRRSWAVPLLESARLTPSALSVRARGPGWLMLRLHRRSDGGRVPPVGRFRLSKGDHVVPIDARGCPDPDVGVPCRPPPPGVYRLHVATKPLIGGYWTRERKLRLRVKR